jgi:hypothetical protein
MVSMTASHEPTLARLRTLKLMIMVWLITPLMGMMPGAVHASATGTVVA